MSQSNKEIYRQICEQENIPLLSQYAWMEAVSIGKDWDVLIVRDAEKEVVAALPYHILCRWGQKVILMPQLTMFSSIWLAKDVNNTMVLSQLAQQLERICKQQHIRYCYLKGDWPEAFRTELIRWGYRLEERHTHQIVPTSDLEQIVNHFNENKRRQYRRAKNLKCVDLTEQAFYEFHHHCLAERGSQITYSFDMLQSIFTPLLSKGHAALWGAEDESGQLLAALGMVWDEQNCYYLLPAYWRPSSKSGAMAWLTAQAILHAGQKGLRFDFEGGNEGGIERSYREFGGTPTAYYSAEKYYNPIFEILFKCLRKS